MDTIGRTVRLFLVDGSPTGIITAEIMNWTGHVLVAPRSRLGEALERMESDRTGVYFLVGDDPQQPSKSLVYVGEGDNVGARLKEHAKDESKDFWARVCFVTSKDQNLTKAHVRYLESRFVKLIFAAERANVSNANEPSPKMLPESDVADMEFFIGQVQVVLPVVGFDFLRPAVRLPTSIAQSVAPVAQRFVELRLRSDSHGVEARALEADGEVTVLKGSLATVKDDFAVNQYALLRKELISDGRLVLSASGNTYIFAEDVIFNSPTAAAAVIFNRNSNGRTAWKVVETDQTLKDWQDAQLNHESEEREV